MTATGIERIVDVDVTEDEGEKDDDSTIPRTVDPVDCTPSLKSIYPTKK
jgi:hypothetical protein